MGWKSFPEEKPKHGGSYLIEKMSDCGRDVWYEVQCWKPQHGIKSLYSEEFKQYVSVKTEKGNMGFEPHDYDFIIKWMEIPGNIYTRGKLKGEN